MFAYFEKMQGRRARSIDPHDFCFKTTGTVCLSAIRVFGRFLAASRNFRGSVFDNSVFPILPSREIVMEMHQVRYFLALADQLNFTRASELCNVTQPSLSRAIKLLEEELGGPLFRRERETTHLTDLGHLVRPHLQSVYDHSKLAKRLSKEFATKWPLKLGIMSTISPEEIVDLIANIRTRHPEVELRL